MGKGKHYPLYLIKAIELNTAILINVVGSKYKAIRPDLKILWICL